MKAHCVWLKIRYESFGCKGVLQTMLPTCLCLKLKRLSLRFVVVICILFVRTNNIKKWKFLLRAFQYLNFHPSVCHHVSSLPYLACWGLRMLPHCIIILFSKDRYKKTTTTIKLPTTLLLLLLLRLQIRLEMWQGFLFAFYFNIFTFLWFPF